jgi:hypothetical protein
VNARILPLLLHALCELLLFDVRYRVFGFRGVYRTDHRIPVNTRCKRVPIEDEVRLAMKWATCLYYKPVRCLQNAIVIARLLRSRGVAAEVTFGYHLEPFFGHAWVEVDGQPLQDGYAYRRAMDLFSGVQPVSNA